MAIADLFNTERAEPEIFHRSPAKKIGKNLCQNPSEVSHFNDSIIKQLHIDLQPPAKLEAIEHSSHQLICLAQFDLLIGQPISNYDALISIIATFSGFSVHMRTRSKVSGVEITHTPSINVFDELILQCAFCNVSVMLAEVLSRFNPAGSLKCTLELLATLSTEHNADCECRRLKGAEHLMEDDVQFGVLESSSDIDANIMNSKGTQ